MNNTKDDKKTILSIKGVKVTNTKGEEKIGITQSDAIKMLQIITSEMTKNGKMTEEDAKDILKKL